MILLIGLVGGAYLLGAIPFGVAVARCSGVDLQTVGSGNIGATNVTRALGFKAGLLVFLLDFAKGLIPTALVRHWCSQPADGLESVAELIPLPFLPVAVAGAAFLGHLYPIYLRFRGGKGVAVGAGVAAGLAPIPFAFAALAWALLALRSRYVSVASLGAAATLLGVRLIEPQAIEPQGYPITLFILAGVLLVVFKHRANLVRLTLGTENVIADRPWMDPLLGVALRFGLALSFGSALFFNFLAAPALFRSFAEVVEQAPSDRTAQEALLPADADSSRRAALASALAGAAVGPLFPLYFALQVGGGFVVVIALGRLAPVWARGARRAWWLAVILSLIGWGLSGEVSRLRLERFSPDPAIRATAKAQFGLVHFVSLSLSALATLTQAVGLALIPLTLRDTSPPAVKPVESSMPSADQP